ncbi:MAG TPA: sterol desaturase family protein [Longimicrobiales bacterium]|nr:sterol desaturase family protein [Longimicrobiales bacterium]
MGIILYSIPFFFLLLFAEVGVQAWTGRRLLRLNDSVADLSLGILSQLSGIFTKFLAVGIFAWVETNWALQRLIPGVPDWPAGLPWAASATSPLGFQVRVPELLSWVAVFLLVDLAYYWSHRLSHQINLLWAGHVVHHSSEEYNLAVALRQSSLHGLFTWVFYLPLALMGIPWEMYVATYALNLVYQFWIHTRAVGKLSPTFEWFLNTPSHHRVHHGINPRYLDRNHAGVLIVWDRMFGTFQPEEEEPVYGITTPLRSWNPLWANLHVFVDIARKAAGAASWRERLGFIFGPPGWRPEAEGGREVPLEVSRETFQPWDTQIPGGLAAYGFVQFTAALAATFLLLVRAGDLPPAHLAAGAFYVTVALAGIGGVFEAARWAGSLETARHLVLAGAVLTLWATGALPATAAGAGFGFTVLSLAWFLPQRRHLVETELAPIM